MVKNQAKILFMVELTTLYTFHVEMCENADDSRQ